MAERMSDTERLAYFAAKLATTSRRNRMWSLYHSYHAEALIAVNGNCEICDNEGLRTCPTCKGNAVIDDNDTACPDCRNGDVTCGCGHIPTQASA